MKKKLIIINGTMGAGYHEQLCKKYLFHKGSNLNSLRDYIFKEMRSQDW